MSPTLSRRGFLTTGATIASGALLGATTGCAPERSLTPNVPGPAPSLDRHPDGDLGEPPLLQSTGVLTASILCATHPVTVAGRTVYEACTYDGAFPGPTLWVPPGGAIDLTFTNRIVATQSEVKPGYGRTHLDAQTNLHFHGAHVPPTGTADNMLVVVDRNRSFRYQFPILVTHPAGLFWYHSHVHGVVTNQVGRGACGMLYVASAYTNAIDAQYRRRLLVLQQVYFQPDLRTLIADDTNRDDPSLALTVINGEEMPMLRMRPGERQVWDVANASTSAFYQLRFPVGFEARILAYDGLTRGPYAADANGVVQLAPGKRVELDVRAPAASGKSVLGLDAYNQGVDTWPAKPLATIAVGGAPATDPGPVPADPAVLPNLAGVTPSRTRTIIFDQDDTVPEGQFGRFRMYLEGSSPHSWNPDVPEWSDSVLGEVEEWTIRNDTTQEHPFHVHVNPFQVMRVQGPYNGSAPPPALVSGYHDVVVVPPRGEAVVRTQFTDFPGGPVLMHCHILDHEDMGMMTSFVIQPA
jgi:suppressor of ftsI